ncbi:probable G-protein coupled receptor CG31760 [Nematostella vectensis]|uniref:probable G-protein coupled receptor CG31760 n=1 Tax=Nematostella vectensis TaxID=45351 RepID=UPI0020776FE5|nr:probable G-protein coupled receptor CG31760 [Nematostella vectensis]
MWVFLGFAVLLLGSYDLAVVGERYKVRSQTSSKFNSPEELEELQESYLPLHGNKPLRVRKDLERHNKDALIQALHHVEEVQRIIDEFNECKPNQSVVLNISFDNNRWKPEASLVVEVANALTSLWRIKESNNLSIAENDNFLYTIVRSNVLFSSNVYGSVVCFERNQYKNYSKGFCPYAFKNKTLNGAVHVKDISVEHDYLDNPDIWWKETKERSLHLVPKQTTEFYSTRYNATHANPIYNRTIPLVTDMKNEGHWTRPYFDCFGGKSWMVTFLAPFFNETSQFLGVVSIDIELNDIDINQCDSDKKTEYEGSKVTGFLEFLGTHRCKPSTKCVPIPNEGFKRGSYVCECKKGFYFPKPSSTRKYFNGSVIEAEYDKMVRWQPNVYNDSFECLRCSEGCSECTDDSKCVYVPSLGTRTLLVAINGVCTLLVLGLGIIVLMNRDVKVFQTSSPVLLILIIVGAILVYSGFAILYINPPTDVTCLVYPWLQNIGFALAYCSLALKTWKLSTTFRARTPRKVEVTDLVMLKHLSLVTAAYVIYLLVWTLTIPPHVEGSVTVGKLIYHRCSVNWFDHAIVMCNGLLLVVALWFCYRVRNAPSPYGENRFISWAIYNAIFVVCFFAILSGLTRSSTNPDILFAVEFVFVHMIATVMMLLIFVPKCIIVRKMKLRGVSSSFTSSKKAHHELSPNSPSTCTGDVSVLERENEDLKTEVQRLSGKLASLQARLMRECNKHIKTSKRDRAGTKDEDGDFLDLRKASPSPIARFLNSRV